MHLVVQATCVCLQSPFGLLQVATRFPTLGTGAGSL
ncbi:hypothetical protein CPAR01_00111 [Colletotrichum paranaense]|uniref:Uncharacterized protein n=1 Tax=Colletotrichum paranaense TaxID=1914294 RepID=A0ABQ9T3T1_9PEZI|nr:uncharacterized protein CPAR01_00111 [Colletotrichum paranaense]KAK1546144.1 hypothetical protein CPAR01_00111 [Colletotrichum paranaense]